MKQQIGGIVYPQVLGLVSNSPASEQSKIDAEKKKLQMDELMRKLEEKNKKK